MSQLIPKRPDEAVNSTYIVIQQSAGSDSASDIGSDSPVNKNVKDSFRPITKLFSSLTITSDFKTEARF